MRASSSKGILAIPANESMDWIIIVQFYICEPCFGIVLENCADKITREVRTAVLAGVQWMHDGVTTGPAVERRCNRTGGSWWQDKIFPPPSPPALAWIHKIHTGAVSLMDVWTTQAFNSHALSEDTCYIVGFQLRTTWKQFSHQLASKEGC